LAAANRFIMVDTLAEPETREDPRLLVVTIRGEQAGNRPADHLVRGIAEKLLSAPVPGHYNAVEALADDRVVGGFDDGAQTLCDLFVALAVADVHQHVYGADERA